MPPTSSQVDQMWVKREEWSAIWSVPEEREYRLKGAFNGGGLVITLDGVPVIDIAPQEVAQLQATEVTLRVRPGEHRIDVIQTPRGLWTGATVHISDPEDPTFVPDLSPF